MDEILKKLITYRSNYQVVSRAHHLTAEAYSRYNDRLGIPVVALSAIISTAIFATLKENPDSGYQMLTGLASVLATILSAQHTFLGFNEKAQSHKNAAISYAVVKRQFDTLHLKHSTLDPRDPAQAEKLLAHADELAEKMPAIPDKFYDQAKNELSA